MSSNTFIALILLSLFYFLSHCVFDEIPKPPIKLESFDSTIIDAKIIRYQDIPEKIRDRGYGFSANWYYKEGENWNEGTEFDAKKAFYLEATIVRKKLAQYNEMYPCGSFWAFFNKELSSVYCTKEELEEKIKEDLHSDNNRFLYGKYKNRWVFYNEKSRKIPETEKFEGHNTIEIITSENNLTDIVLIGPIPEKPSIMEIKPSTRNPDNYIIKFDLKKNPTPDNPA